MELHVNSTRKVRGIIHLASGVSVPHFTAIDPTAVTILNFKPKWRIDHKCPSWRNAASNAKNTKGDSSPPGLKQSTLALLLPFITL